MSRRTSTFVFCDRGHRGGQEVEATSSHELVIDGKSYRVDLCENHERQFAETMDVYRSHPTLARRNGKRRVNHSPLPSGVEPAVVRAWANENGYEVPARGRIKGEIMEAFANAS